MPNIYNFIEGFLRALYKIWDQSPWNSRLKDQNRLIRKQYLYQIIGLLKKIRHQRNQGQRLNRNFKIQIHQKITKSYSGSYHINYDARVQIKSFWVLSWRKNYFGTRIAWWLSNCWFYWIQSKYTLYFSTYSHNHAKQGRLWPTFIIFKNYVTSRDSGPEIGLHDRNRMVTMVVIVKKNFGVIFRQIKDRSTNEYFRFFSKAFSFEDTSPWICKICHPYPLKSKFFVEFNPKIIKII